MTRQTQLATLLYLSNWLFIWPGLALYITGCALALGSGISWGSFALLGTVNALFWTGVGLWMGYDQIRRGMASPAIARWVWRGSAVFNGAPCLALAVGFTQTLAEENAEATLGMLCVFLSFAGPTLVSLAGAFDRALAEAHRATGTLATVSHKETSPRPFVML